MQVDTSTMHTAWPAVGGCIFIQAGLFLSHCSTGMAHLPPLFGIPSLKGSFWKSQLLECWLRPLTSYLSGGFFPVFNLRTLPPWASQCICPVLSLLGQDRWVRGVCDWLLTDVDKWLPKHTAATRTASGSSRSGIAPHPQQIPTSLLVSN